MAGMPAFEDFYFAYPEKFGPQGWNGDRNKRPTAMARARLLGEPYHRRQSQLKRIRRRAGKEGRGSRHNCPRAT